MGFKQFPLERQAGLIILSDGPISGEPKDKEGNIEYFPEPGGGGG